MCIIFTYIRMKTICIMDTCILLLELPHHRYMHQTYMHASRSRSRIIDMCIIHTCIIVKDRGTQIYASHIHVSGSRIIDICIIHKCMLQGQGLRTQTYASYMHVSGLRIMANCIIHMCIIVKCIRNQSQSQSRGSRNIDKCIIHTCMLQDQGPVSQISDIRVKDQGTQIYASYMLVSGSSILDKCIIHLYDRYVHHGHMCKDQEHIYASHMHTYTRVKNHTYMHASGSRSSTIDIGIIHTCIRVKDLGTLIMHHTCIYQDKRLCIIQWFQ